MPHTPLPVRGTDPDTSQAAAMQATERAPVVRDVVLRVVREQGPLTHDELIGAYHMLVVMKPDTPRASESGIRTRLSELKRAGLVIQDAEEGTSSFGNRAKRWIAVDPDDPYFGYDLDAMTPYFSDEDIVGFDGSEDEDDDDAVAPPELMRSRRRQGEQSCDQV